MTASTPTMDKSGAMDKNIPPISDDFSRTLFSYTAKLYGVRFLALLFGVCVILQMLDLMAKSDDILAGQGETYMAIFRYIALRFPSILSQFAPFTALLAAIMTLATLNTSSEIVIMKSAGLSVYRILSPMIAVSVLIAISHFIFNETVTVHTTARLDHWEANDYAANLPPPPESSQKVWLTENNNLIEVEKITRNGKILVLDGVTQFERDNKARLMAVEKADFAVYQDNKWTMFDVRRFNVATHETTSEESANWPIETPPDRFLALSIKPEHVSIVKLYRSIQELNPTGHPASVLISALYRKITGPAASIIMPLLAALAGFGVNRSGMLFIRVIIGMALGFGYFVVDNMIAAMGEFGKLPPLLAAGSAFVLFLVVGILMLLYTEE